MIDTSQIIKYLIEGLAVGVTAYMIMRNKITQQEVLTIALTAAAVFAVLDNFSPSVSLGARLGTGFGLGAKMLGGGESPGVI